AHLDWVSSVVAARPGPVCVLSYGETTVRVTGDGRGGRNQEFALAAAIELERRHLDWQLASVGTDGVDGPTDAAGALVDGRTAARARDRGVLPEAHLASNDSYGFFARTGGHLRTGPTDTNVGDVQVLLVPGGRA
ncbi:MAG TPA: MOFRL family protein, partial [Vicinamibacterales bacterium]